MSASVLCIDFGTAFSKAAAAPAGAWAAFDAAMVQPLQINPHGDGNAFLLDSAVFVDEAAILFGRAALARAGAVGGKRAALRSFKTLLRVDDLDVALNAKAPASIDPRRSFRMRDLFVLYLAYLLAAIGRGRRGVVEGEVTLRCAAPAWREGDSAALHAGLTRLFGEAEAVRAVLGEALLEPAGIGLAHAADALAASAQRAAPLRMGLIHEAAAAAAYTSIGLSEQATHMIVVDVGAGTTDITALTRIDDQLIELAEARTTLDQAGDYIDRVIANRVIDAAKWLKSAEQKGALWTDLMRDMREAKATLFAEGVLTRRVDGRALTLSLRDVERDPDFQAFAKSVKAAYAACTGVVRADAVKHPRCAIEAVAVGGGGGAPFIQALIAAKAKRGPPITPRPATPGWAHAEEFRGNLAPVFPQLAIAIGGALAPANMLAAT